MTGWRVHAWVLMSNHFKPQLQPDSVYPFPPEHGEGYRSCKPVDSETLARLRA